MQPIFLDNPAWLTTFPHPVAPLPNEWLPGLLLRCDEANHWACKTTLQYVLRSGPEKFHRCWYTGTPNLAVIPHCSFNLNYLAQLLALPTRALLSTTYHTELARCYDNYRPRPEYLSPSLSFHLCPVCLAKDRILRRSLILPHITHCPLHEVILQKLCLCGNPLRIFHSQAQPFTCYSCGLDWANLPQVNASKEQLSREQRFLSWYEWFFSEGSVRRAVALVEKIAPQKVYDINGEIMIKVEVKGSFRKTKFGSKKRYSWKPLPLSVLVLWLVNSNMTPYNVKRSHAYF